MKDSISIAVVGLGFGAEFAAIYNRHPDVRRTVIVDANRKRLTRVGDRFDICLLYTSPSPRD